LEFIGTRCKIEAYIAHGSVAPLALPHCARREKYSIVFANDILSAIGNVGHVPIEHKGEIIKSYGIVNFGTIRKRNIAIMSDFVGNIIHRAHLTS